MLIGEYLSNVTAGNRTALPKKLRSNISDKLIISKGYEECLFIFSEEQWENMISKAVNGSITTVGVRDTLRFLYGGAHEIDLDAQGRFVIPSRLIQFSQITEAVVFLGLGRWIEVWDEKKWRVREEYLRNEGSIIAESLKKRLTNEDSY
jgi:MraZ protein